jgi:hypothetical protein
MKKFIALLAIMTLLMTGTAFANGNKESKESRVEVQELKPEPGSDVLDKVQVFKGPGEQEDTIFFDMGISSGEEESGIELQVDTEKGTYKATKEYGVPDSVKDRSRNNPPDFGETPPDFKPQQFNQKEKGTGDFSAQRSL